MFGDLTVKAEGLRLDFMVYTCLSALMEAKTPGQGRVRCSGSGEHAGILVLVLALGSLGLCFGVRFRV